MAANRANFGDLLEPIFRKIFFDNFSEIPEVFPSIYHVNTSDKQEEKMSAVTGFGYMTETSEGEQITYEDPVNTLAAYSSNVIRKFLKLREHLNKKIETIRSQTEKLADFLGGSETIIGTSLSWG